MDIRLQKILAQAGFGSRRSCEEIIIAGRVSINGEMATIGMKADPTKDMIQVDGRQIRQNLPDKIYIALNKPKFVLSDQPENDSRKTVFDFVRIDAHLFVVGRLDFDSEGLILLTNDGSLANQLTHPRYGHEKEYRVLVARKPDAEQLATWRRGVILEDGIKTAPARVEVEKQAAKNVWLRVILREGKKRQIRETGARIGLPVERIVRIRIGTLQLGTLKPGEWRHLSKDEVQSLRESVKPPTKKKEQIGTAKAVNKTNTRRIVRKR